VLVQIVGLAATGWMVWSYSVLPRLAFQYWSSLVAEGLKWAVLAGASSAVITLILLGLTRSLDADGLALALRTSATAVWFAPAIILLAVFSPVSFGAALVLVVSATRLLYSQWSLLPPAVPSSSPVLFPAPFYLAPPFPWRARVSALACAFALQGSVVSLLGGYPLAAACLICLGMALLTLRSLVARDSEVRRTETLPRSFLGLLLTVILSAGLTVGGGLTVGLASDSGSPGSSAAPRSPARAPVASVYVPPPAAEEINLADRGVPGVILWPEVKPQTQLVAPLPSWVSKPGPAPLPPPATIPFSGAYWIFRPPNLRPPQRSYFQKASPLKLSFVTTDHIPLRMEAHQRLEHEIDLQCCSAIQIAISNADSYPGSITLELILIDGQEPVPNSQTLGTAEVASWPLQTFWSREVSPVSDLLNFVIPARMVLRQFNEIAVLFHFSLIRRDRSARISIERFVLLPRS
jgi:hypothetical protein